MEREQAYTRRVWIARIIVLAVFICNMQCAYSFMFHPEDAIEAYQIAGAGAIPVTRSIGISFMLWNVTYPLVIWKPLRFRTLFIIVIIQQALALASEICLMFTLGPEMNLLFDAIFKFIRFDAPGLILMILAYAITRQAAAAASSTERASR